MYMSSHVTDGTARIMRTYTFTMRDMRPHGSHVPQMTVKHDALASPMRWLATLRMFDAHSHRLSLVFNLVAATCEMILNVCKLEDLPTLSCTYHAFLIELVDRTR